MPETAPPGSSPFGAWLDAAMRKAGHNQMTLSAALELSHTAIGNYINKGSIPFADKVVPLAVALGVTVEEVLTALGTPPPPQTRRLYTLPEDLAPSGTAQAKPAPSAPNHYPGPVFFRLRTVEGRVISEHRSDGYEIGPPVEIVVEGP